MGTSLLVGVMFIKNYINAYFVYFYKCYLELYL